MRGKTILALLFLLACAALLAYYFRFVSGDFQFRSRLLKIDPGKITAFSVYAGGEERIFSLDEQGWMVSDGQRAGIHVPPSEISGMLRQLGSLYADGAEDGGAAIHARCGLQAGQGMQVRIWYGQQLVEDFLLGLEDTSQQIVYFRFAGQEEVFRVPSGFAAPFRRPYAYYRDMRFAAPPMLERLDSITYAIPADSLSWRLLPAGGRWGLVLKDTLGLDSLAFSSWWMQLGRLASVDFADDFDELLEGAQEARRLEFWIRDRPVLRLFCYERSGHPVPFVLNSSQRPDDFFASDSSGLFREVFSALDTLLLPLTPLKH